MNFWKSLAREARIGMTVGLVVILVLAAAAASWLLRTDYQVLFANLSPQDAGAMVSELDRMKVPYKLDDSGATILVDSETVHKTRIKLMGKDLPLHGTVGFELFNNSDFGMTEFAQKINYQRALQGEISRTILALSEIEAVRVHLALPEEGLFKRANSKVKASITVTMKRGQTLQAEQVTGIQRLVAAAVPNINTQDVTIVDQRGVALTRVAQGEAEGDANSPRLDLKKETEVYLSRKAGAVLERRFGAGQAMASVDVTLDMDQVRVTTEEVIGAPGRVNQAPTGVVVRERETLRDSASSSGGKVADSPPPAQREVEYQAGRRVEQIVATPGSIQRIHVAAVVRQPLDAAQLEQVRALVFAAVGASQERGDVVVVQTLPAVGTPAAESGPTETPSPAAIPVQKRSAVLADIPPVETVALILLAVVVILGVGILRSRRPSAPVVLTVAERQLALAKIRSWVSQEVASAPPTDKARKVQS